MSQQLTAKLSRNLMRMLKISRARTSMFSQPSYVASSSTMKATEHIHVLQRMNRSAVTPASGQNVHSVHKVCHDLIIMFWTGGFKRPFLRAPSKAKYVVGFSTCSVNVAACSRTLLSLSLIPAALLQRHWRVNAGSVAEHYLRSRCTCVRDHTAAVKSCRQHFLRKHSGVATSAWAGSAFVCQQWNVAEPAVTHGGDSLWTRQHKDTNCLSHMLTLRNVPLRFVNCEIIVGVVCQAACRHL